MIAYPAVIVIDHNNNYVVTFPDIAEAYSKAGSIDRALKVARDSLINTILKDLEIEEHIYQPTMGISSFLVEIPRDLEVRLKKYNKYVARAISNEVYEDE